MFWRCKWCPGQTLLASIMFCSVDIFFSMIWLIKEYSDVLFCAFFLLDWMEPHNYTAVETSADVLHTTDCPKLSSPV